MTTCQTCKHLKPKKEGILIAYYCSLGVTNRRDDPNRKNGKCTKYEKLDKSQA